MTAAAEAPLWLSGALAPSPGVRRLSLGGREALFCERRQQLFELDAAGAAIWDELAAGRALEAVAQALSVEGLPPATTTALCLARAREWSEAGWLAPQRLTARLAEPPDRVLGLRLGGMAARIELRLEDGDALRADLENTFGQFAEAEPASDALRLDVIALGERCFVLRQGLPVSLVPAEQVTPEIKALLTEALCGCGREGGLWLHAAMLSHNGGGLLLAGAPGAGKTTLAVTLAMRGFGYATDDLVAVSPSGDFRGVAFSPAVKAGAWPLLRDRAPGLLDLPVHLRADGQEVRYLPASRLPSAGATDPRWLVLLDRREGAAAALHHIDPLSALTELLGSAYAADHRLTGATLTALGERFARMDCLRLVHSDLDAAAACLEALTDG